MSSAKELEKLYRRFNDKRYLALDPLSMVDASLEPGDFELCSFITAGLSYGRVEQINASLSDLWRRLEKSGLGKNGRGLQQLLTQKKKFNSKRWNEILKGWKHRLNTADDLVLLFSCFAKILESHQSLGHFFQRSYLENPKDHLSNFCRLAIMKLENESPRLKSTKKSWSGTGLNWFFCSPENGSSCKRLLMWLRWMIRQDEIDTGLWRDRDKKLIVTSLPLPDPSRLFHPVDAHIFKWAQKTKVLTQKTSNWRGVELITEHFKSINSADPVKYDFAICHESMLEIRQT